MKEINETQLQLSTEGKRLPDMIKQANGIHELVKQKLSEYNSIEYTDDNIKVAKADRATLNKAKKGLNDSRIELEKAWMKPFNELKDVVNETCKLIGEASSRIDSKIKETEEKEKQKKLDQIREYFEEHNENLILFDFAFRPEWLNKTKALSVVKMEIDELFKTVDDDLNRLKEYFAGESFYIPVIDKYTSTLDYNKSFDYGNHLKEAAIQAGNRQFEQKSTDKTPQQQKPEIKPQNEPKTNEEEVYIRGFKVHVTRKQAFALAEFMNSHNIKFESISI